MKTLLILTAAIIGSFSVAAASAGPFGLPDHQSDGYRDTGCVAALNVEVTDSAGNVLYISNPTCRYDGQGGGLLGAFPVDAPAEELPDCDPKA